MGIKALRISPELLVAMCKPRGHSVNCITGLPADAELVGEPVYSGGDFGNKDLILFIKSAEWESDGYKGDDYGAFYWHYTTGKIPECPKVIWRAEY